MGDQELAVVLKLVADQFKRELTSSKGILGGFNAAIKDWRVQLGAAGTALFAIAKSTANYGDHLFKTSQKIGIQVEQLSALEYAAKLADVSQETLATSLRKLSVNVSEAASGSKEQVETFKRMGIEIKGVDGKVRPLMDIVGDMADVFAGANDGIAKTDLSIKAMGKSGAEMIPFLNGGKAGMHDLMKEAERLGLVMKTEDAKAAEEFNDNLTRLESSARGLTLAVGKPLIGPLSELADVLKDIASGPVGGAVGFFMDKLQRHLIALNVLSKEVTLNWKALKGEINFDQLKAGVDAAEAEGHKKLFLLDHPNAPKNMFDDPKAKGGSGGSKKNLPLPAPSAGKIGKMLDEERKMREEALKRDEALQKTSLETMEIMLEQDAKRKLINEQTFVASKGEIRLRELENHGATLAKMKEIEVEFYNKRKRLPFEHNEERLTFEKQHAAELQKIDGEILQNSYDVGKQELQNYYDNDNARLKSQEELGRRIVEMTKAEYEIKESLGKQEEERGRRIVERTKSEYEILKAIKDRERGDEVALQQARLEAYELGLQGAEVLSRQRERIHYAQLAKDLGLEQEQVDRIIELRLKGEEDAAEQLLSLSERTAAEREAIVTRAEARIAKEQRIQQDPVWEGLREGLHKYVNDQGSMFSMSVDMARQTAQGMASGFQSLFFDAMQLKFHSLESIADSSLRFIQQIASQILAQMVTAQIMGGVANGLGGGTSIFGAMFNSMKGPGFGAAANSSAAAGVEASAGVLVASGGLIQRFAVGGPVRSVFSYSNGDSVPAMLKPGEYVVNTKGMDALSRLNQGDAGGFRPQRTERPVMINMTVNTPDAGSFRKSQGQVLAEARLAMNRAVRNL